MQPATMTHPIRNVSAVQPPAHQGICSVVRLEFIHPLGSIYMSIHEDLVDVDVVTLSPVHDLGDGLSSRRVLPSGRQRMVGPFVFVDHLGPRLRPIGEKDDSLLRRESLNSFRCRKNLSVSAS
jgi:hypothetical protein